MLDVQEVVKEYRSRVGLFDRRSKVLAVDHVSLNITPGETLGLVGESGCGKSTLARVLLMLERPSAGKIRFLGNDLTGLKANAMRQIRRKMQIVFQDCASSFDPRYTVENIIGEPLNNFSTFSAPERKKRIINSLDAVELGEDYLQRYPDELSGGQAQRVGLARALVIEPDFVVLDEPLSSLDLSVQAQILNLLKKIKLQRNHTILFISHDLRAVRFLSDRVAVMYMGRLMEVLPAARLENAVHPYTRLLLGSIPVNDPLLRENRHGRGSGIDRTQPRVGQMIESAGCRFVHACDLAKNDCKQQRPPMRTLGRDHSVACLFPAVKSLC